MHTKRFKLLTLQCSSTLFLVFSLLLYRCSRSFNTQAEWLAVTTSWPMRQSMHWATWQLRLRGNAMFVCWRRHVILFYLMSSNFPVQIYSMAFPHGLNKVDPFEILDSEMLQQSTCSWWTCKINMFYCIYQLTIFLCFLRL